MKKMKESDGMKMPGVYWMLPVIMAAIQIAAIVFLITGFEEELSGEGMGTMLYSLFLMYSVGAFLPGVMFNFAYLTAVRNSVNASRTTKKTLLTVAGIGYLVLIIYSAVKWGAGDMTVYVAEAVAIAYLLNYVIPFIIISRRVNKNLSAE